MKFYLEVDPRPQPRPRFTRGRTFTPAEIVQYKAAIGLAGKSAMEGKPPIEGEVQARMKFTRKFKATSKRFGDADNLFKAVADALNGIAYLDDAQIVESSVMKIKGEVPSVEVEIIALQFDNSTITLE